MTCIFRDACTSRPCEDLSKAFAFGWCLDPISYGQYCSQAQVIASVSPSEVITTEAVLAMKMRQP